jgi:hypothetical protein
MGVPTLGCPCRVCHSQDPQDKRTRPSVLFSRAGRNVVIDTTPDFRQQALREDLQRLDAVVFTHSHADHILGFDDIRPFNMRQGAAMPVYSGADTLAVLQRVFAYAFQEPPPEITVPRVALHPIDGPFELLDTTWTPVPAEHGNMPVLGFRVAACRRNPSRCWRDSTTWCSTPCATSPTPCTRPSNRRSTWSPSCAPGAPGSRTSPTTCRTPKPTSAWPARDFLMCSWPMMVYASRFAYE